MLHYHARMVASDERLNEHTEITKYNRKPAISMRSACAPLAGEVRLFAMHWDSCP